MSFVALNTIPANIRLFWAAALRRAVFDYVLYRDTPGREVDWAHARDYIFLDNMEYSNGLDIEQVCALFGWEPDYIRRLARSLTRKDIKRMEVGSFKDDFNFDEVEATPKSRQTWNGHGAVLPYYPRLLDEYTHTRKLSKVWVEKDRFEFPKHLEWCRD